MGPVVKLLDEIIERRRLVSVFTDALRKSGDWDESEHPRDEDGKFSSGGGGGGGGSEDEEGAVAAPASEQSYGRGATWRRSESSAENGKRVNRALEREAGASYSYRFATHHLAQEYKSFNPGKENDAKVEGLKRKIGESFYKEAQKFRDQGKTAKALEGEKKAAEMGYTPPKAGGTIPPPPQPGERPPPAAPVTPPAGRGKLESETVFGKTSLLPGSPNISIRVRGSAKEEAGKQVQKQMLVMPAAVRKQLGTMRISVGLGFTVRSILPKHMQANWGNAQGLYSGAENAIYLASFVNGQLQHGGGVNVVLHEAMHSYDSSRRRANTSFLRYSEEKDFRDAWAKDKHLMDSYYRDSPPGRSWQGAAEAFAEGAAKYWVARSGGEAHSNPKGRSQVWPNVQKYFEDHFGKFK